MSSNQSKDRINALRILLKVLQDNQPLSLLLQEPNLSSLSKALCFGVARHYYRLAKVADAMVSKRPKDLDIFLCIILGLYQLDEMAMPDYAVVQETVNLLKYCRKLWAKPLVNALLRRYCREAATIQSALKEDAEYQYNHPQWLIQYIQHDWPKDWRDILKANNAHPPQSLRINLSKQSLNDYLKKLEEAGLAFKIAEHTRSGLILDKPLPVSEIPGFLQGEISVQDAAAQLAGPLLALAPGLRVLDACCAPGGKLGQILELEPNLADCVGMDIDPKRLSKVLDNCQRLSINPRLAAGDAAKPKEWWDGQAFDRILLDAPCSASGIIRRQPDIKLHRSPEDILKLTITQAALLEALWPLVAENGLLVYATCSIFAKENEQQVAAFISKHPDAQANTKPQDFGRCTGHGWQILPGEFEMDGFFYAQIRKTAKKKTSD